MIYKKGKMLFEISNLEYKQGREIITTSLIRHRPMSRTYYLGSFLSSHFYTVNEIDYGSISDQDTEIFAEVTILSIIKFDSVYKYYFYTKPTTKEVK